MTSVEVVLGSISAQDVGAIVTAAKGTVGAAMAVPTPNGGYVFHTAGENWCGGSFGEATALTNCYRNCLILAEELGVRSIAFPPLATEIYGFPPEPAADLVAMAVRSLDPIELDLIRLLTADEPSRDLLTKALARPIVEHCPTCGATAIPVLIGLPTADARTAGDTGLLHLAGCFSTGPDNDPQWQCAADQEHQWTNGEDDAARWQAAIGQAIQSL